MTFSFACLDCGHVNQVPWSLAGRAIPCGGCARLIAVPVPRETIDGCPAEKPVGLRFTCPSCGRKFATSPDLIGRKIRCSGCGAGVRVPVVGPHGGSVSSSSSPAVNSHAPAGMARIPTTEPARSTSRRREVAMAPLPVPLPLPATPPPTSLVSDSPERLVGELAQVEEVSEPGRAGTVLPSRAAVMDQVRRDVSAKAEEKAVAEKAKKKKKRRKKSNGYFDPKDTMILVGGILAFVAVLAGLAWNFPDFRFPLGGLLCVMGFVVYLLGMAALRQLVAEEGTFTLLLFRFCPPYQWFFVATHWSETRDYVAFLGAGMMILTIGGAVLKVSPQGRKADDSERVYQRAQAGVSGFEPSAMPVIPQPDP